MTLINRPFWHPLAEEILNADGEKAYNSWAFASFQTFKLVTEPGNKEIEQKVIEMALLSSGTTKDKISELIRMIRNFRQEAAIRELQSHLAEGFEVLAHQVYGLDW